MNAQTKERDGELETVVERRFPTSSTDVLDRPDFTSGLQDHDGILGVTPDRRQASVSVRYDVRRLNFADVQDLLEQAGAPCPAGLWQRWRCGWYANLDSNMRDNAGHRAACCSRPPPGAGRQGG